MKVQAVTKRIDGSASAQFGGDLVADKPCARELAVPYPVPENSCLHRAVQRLLSTIPVSGPLQAALEPPQHGSAPGSAHPTGEKDKENGTSASVGGPK